jgi:adenylate kinase
MLVSRIVNRANEAAAEGKPVRADDNEDSLRVRLMSYYKLTSPLIGYYHAKGLLTSIDGMGTMDEVKAGIAAALEP